MTPEQKFALEKKLGRPLSMREAIFEAIEHKDNRTREQRFDSQNWRVVLEQAPEETKFDAALREAQEIAEAEAVKKLSNAERMVVMMKRARNDELAKKAAEKSHQARLASPEVAKPLQALRELLKSYEWNPAVGLAEVEAVNQAIEQYETPKADLAVAKRLFDQAFDAERGRRTAMLDSVVAKMTELGAQRAELDAAVASLSKQLPSEREQLEAEFLAADFSTPEGKAIGKRYRAAKRAESTSPKSDREQLYDDFLDADMTTPEGVEVGKRYVAMKNAEEATDGQ